MDSQQLQKPMNSDENEASDPEVLRGSVTIPTGKKSLFSGPVFKLSSALFMLNLIASLLVIGVSMADPDGIGTTLPWLLLVTVPWGALTLVITLLAVLVNWIRSL